MRDHKIERLETCIACHKAITPESRQGSFTSFLFAHNRCQCKAPLTGCVTSSKLIEVDSGLSTENPQALRPLEDLVNINLDHNYEIIEMIGQGGMGSVWKVRDKRFNAVLAIKVLKEELLSDRIAVKRFEQESQAACSLTHSNLCPVYGLDKTVNGTPFLKMEYLEGENLAEILERESYLPLPRALDLAQQICEGLAYAHEKGIVHRDLKPSNIIVCKTPDNNDIVKIVDFGIAKLLSSINEQTSDLTRTGDLFGSPLYMSPEQCKGETVDARSDIYSLGCVLYETLTGRSLFAAENPIKIILKHLEQEPQIALLNQVAPSSVSSTIERCLEKLPDARFQTAAELAKHLELIQNGQEPLLARPRNALQREREKIVGRRIAATLIDGCYMGISYHFLILIAMFATIVIGTLCISPSDLTWLTPFQGYSGRLAVSPEIPFLLGFFDNCLVYPALGWMTDGGHHGLFTAAFSAQAPLLDKILRLWYSISTILMLFWNWLYHAFCESSKDQATFGKKLTGLTVVAMSGARPTFKQATIRHFSKIVFLPLLPLEFIANFRRWKKVSHSNPRTEAWMDLILSPFHDRLGNVAVVIRKDKASGTNPNASLPAIERNVSS